MLLFFGKPAKDLSHDENASRAARLGALREAFHQWKHWPEFAPGNAAFAPVALPWLLREVEERRSSGLPAYGDRARILVINAHGNDQRLSGLDAGQLLQRLLDLGLEDAGTEEIWLAACNNGLQTQDNTGPDLIASELARLLAQRGLTPKVRAPRGLITYRGRHAVDVGGGQTALRYKEVVIVAKDGPWDPAKGENRPHAYPFTDGWVLANP